MRNTARNGGTWRTGILVAMLAGAPALAWAADPIPGGEEEYLRYCASCHGLSGKGDGVVAEVLTPKPTDLTQLAKAAGGELSSAMLRQGIDGTKAIRAHGDSKMPVWGEVLRPATASPVGAERRGKLMLITDFVMSIQEK